MIGFQVKIVSASVDGIKTALQTILKEIETGTTNAHGGVPSFNGSYAEFDYTFVEGIVEYDQCGLYDGLFDGDLKVPDNLDQTYY